MKRIVYIGDDFYSQSDTVMSSVYEIVGSGFHRTDWGFIELALKEGEEIHIRPATTEELGLFYRKLMKVRSRL